MASREVEREQIERDEIIESALSVRTLEECEHAEGLIITWMKEHPRDFGVLDAGEVVAMVSGKYEPPSAGTQLPA